ncbi:MAG: DUF6064 family protein [Burkholderiaceae bacterium]
MSEWWTYRPSDFLLFAPRTYYRLVETYNAELWPAQLVALAAALLFLAMAWRGSARAGRFVALGLAASWTLVAWRFHWTHYATINWAAVYFTLAFGAQAGLLIGAALLDALRYDRRPSTARRYAGLALVVIALAVQPLAALMLGRPARQLEVAGLFPDPTALLTLGLLLIAGRAHWSLFPVPVLWCLVSATTLWTMNAADALLPLVGALVATVAAIGLRPRPEQGSAVMRPHGPH